MEEIKIKLKLKLRSFKSSEHIFEKGDGPYRGFGYSSLVSDPLMIFGYILPCKSKMLYKNPIVIYRQKAYRLSVMVK